VIKFLNSDKKQNQKGTSSTQNNTQNNSTLNNDSLPSYFSNLSVALDQSLSVLNESRAMETGQDGNSSSLPTLNLSDLQHELSCLRSNDNMIPIGYQTELSLRHAKILKEKNIVKIEYPKLYKKQYREIIKAGAQQLNLNYSQSYFYELGYHLLPVPPSGDNDEDNQEALDNFDPEDEDIAVIESMCQCFQERFPIMLDKDVGKYESYLDNIELEVLKHSLACQNRWNDFEKGRSKSLRSLTISRKRKL